MKTTIGVFDSGVGGLTTASAIHEANPDVRIIYHNDHANCPYGERSKAELLEITSKIVQKLKDADAKIIVIACNTATTQCIHDLRRLFPDLLFIGTEPAIKVACDAGCKKILLMATPGTTKSARTKELIKSYSAGREVVLLPCPKLANTIEESTNIVNDRAIFRRNSKVQEQLNKLLYALPNRKSFDAVVLGCTHYIYLKPDIKRFFPKAKIFDGNLGVSQQVRILLQTQPTLNKSHQKRPSRP